MVGKANYRSVPTAADLENSSNQNKYTVNRKPGRLVIRKSLCPLMVIGALLLALLVGLLVFFLVPRCSNGSLLQESDNVQSKIGNPYNFLNNAENELTFSTNDLLEVDERLSKNIEPTHYRLQITPWFNTLLINGTVETTLNIHEDTDQIIFHAKNIKIDTFSVKVRSVKSGQLVLIKYQSHIKSEKYKIVLDGLLYKNNIYLMSLTYEGNLNNHLRGFYTSYYNDNFRKRYLASTQFSPTDARSAFPCFDEPSFKANFSLIIGRPITMSSLGNMPMEKTQIDEKNRNLVWDYYKTTPKITSYLVAFVISDFKAYGSDKIIKIWTRESFSKNTKYASDIAPQILRFFEKYLNVSLPLSKIDIVGIPDFGYSAMENWGLITFRESLLLHFTEEDVNSKREIATSLSHELGHQWFGNLVTPKWWNDLWLKEGLANYFQYLGTDHVEPSWKIKDEFIIFETSRAFAVDAFESARPLNAEIKNNKQIQENFNELSYAKGAAIMRMINYFLGENTFKNGLTNFLQKYEYRNADHNDFFEILTEEARKSKSLDVDVNVEDVMESWINQAGFPVVTAARDVANKKLILSQRRFLFSNGNNNSTWWIPISIATNNDPNFNNSKPKAWLKKEQVITLDLNASLWYLINIDQSGYFIVNYDEVNWRHLTENIMKLPVLIRAQLISDSMDLARANLLDYDIPLKIIQRVALRDRLIMYVPTHVTFNKLEYLSDMLYSTPVFGLFETFHFSIFKDTYAIVNSDKNYNSDAYLPQRIRKTVLKWACRSADSECAITAHRMFRNWMEHKITIPANIWDVVYCTAIRQGSEAEWQFAYHYYLNSTSVVEKNALLDALGCTTKKWLLSRFLSYLVQNDSSIRVHDVSRVFSSVCNNNIGKNMAFTFLRSHWNELLSYYGEGFGILSKLVKCLPRYVNTVYQLKELIRFRNEVRNNITTTSQAFDLAIQNARSNVEWMKNSYPSVEKWLLVHQEHFSL